MARSDSLQSPKNHHVELRTVEVMIGTYADILGVPVGAVTEHFQQNYVYVQKGKSFERRPVKTGRSTHAFVEILEGLEAGEVIAMDAYQRGTNDFAAAERKAGGGQAPPPRGSTSESNEKQ